MVLEDQVVLACPDTGASGNFMSKETLHSLGMTRSLNTVRRKTLVLPTGQRFKSVGSVSVACKFAKD